MVGRELLRNDTCRLQTTAADFKYVKPINCSVAKVTRFRCLSVRNARKMKVHGLKVASGTRAFGNGSF